MSISLIWFYKRESYGASVVLVCWQITRNNSIPLYALAATEKLIHSDIETSIDATVSRFDARVVHVHLQRAPNPKKCHVKLTRDELSAGDIAAHNYCLITPDGRRALPVAIGRNLFTLEQEERR